MSGRLVRAPELDRRPVAETRVEALPIIDVRDEPGEVGLGLREGPVILQVQFLYREAISEKVEAPATCDVV
jgi:hypothetical protein